MRSWRSGWRPMALEDEPTGTFPATRRPFDHLRACAALLGVDDATLARLAEGATQLSLPAGNVLHEAGSPCDGMYLVTAGRLGVRTAGAAAWTAQIQGGELVGELSWLMHAEHSAQLVAIPLLDPVGERSAEIEQRIADRRHLPVEHAEHLREVLRGEHDVVELEVVVNQRRPALLRQVIREPARGLIDQGPSSDQSLAQAFSPGT